MQHAVAAFDQAAVGDGRIEFRNLRLQVLVDEKLRLQRAANVAAAIGHDFVDSCVA